MVHHRVAIGLGAADQGAQLMGPIRHVLTVHLDVGIVRRDVSRLEIEAYVTSNDEMSASAKRPGALCVFVS